LLGGELGDGGEEGDLAAGGPGVGLGKGEAATDLGEPVGEGESATEETQVLWSSLHRHAGRP